jgi:hypothetical protein
MLHRTSGSRRFPRLAAFGTAVVLASVVAMTAPAGASVPDPGFGHVRGGRLAPAVGATVSVSPATLAFPSERAGTYSGIPKIVTVTNTGSVPVVFSEILSSTDFGGTTTCFAHASLAAAASCTITVYFFPNAFGTRSDTLQIKDNAAGSPQKVSMSGQGTEGYYVAGAHGQVGNFGDAVFHGDATSIGLTQPIISIKTTRFGSGYWLLGSDGGIFSYGDAKFFGSTGGIHLNKPVVGMERTLSGNGYWLVASDGGIFSYGDAKFFGSTGAIHLNQPVVGMARTPTGNGYWLVARDGGIFSFGDAKFFGSTGAIHLNKPIVGMVARPNAKGYWMHASDGGIFAFGDAPFYGSSAASGSTTAGMATTPDGGGYWIVSTTGTVYHYGNAPSLGDLPSSGVTANDVVGLAPTSPPLPFNFFF